jgi:type VII secretion protein EccB
MQTKRDQVQAHNFVAGRLRSALLSGDADAIATPTRRFSLAMFGGAMLGIILIAVLGVIGFLRPSGNDKWQKPGTIVVDKSSGTRFLFLNGALRPVANLTSARLLVGAKAPIVRTPSASLRSVPHGGPIGILGAPDTLPAKTDMTPAQWLLCASTRQGAASSSTPFTSVLIDQNLTTQPVKQDSAAAVRAPDGTTYLAWRGHRLRLTDRSALIALGFDRVAPISVSAAWLNGLPAGPDLRAPNISRRGAPATEVAGSRGFVGQVYATTGLGGERAFYLMQSDGLMPITPTEAALVLADPRTSVAYPNGTESAISIGTDQLVAAARSSATAAWNDLPDSLPTPTGAAQLAPTSLCVQLIPRAGADPVASLVSVDVSQVHVSELAGTSSNAAGDTVTVAPNRGVLIVGQGAPNTVGLTLSLITDVGVRFPLRSTAVQGLLGYPDIVPARIPSALLDDLPSGPDLDPTKVTGLGGP